MKNYIISNNNKLEIKNIEKITSDIHLYNHIKYKKRKKIEYLECKSRSKKDYSKDYDFIKRKSSKYSLELRNFLNKYHENKFSDVFWDKLLNEQLYRLTLWVYDFYTEFNFILKKDFCANISSNSKFKSPHFFSEILSNIEFDNTYRDEILKIFLQNLGRNKIHKSIKLKIKKNINDINTKKKNIKAFHLNNIFDFDLIFSYLENKIRKKFFNSGISTIAIIKSYFHTKYRLKIENKSNLRVITLNFHDYQKNDKIDKIGRDNLSNCIIEKDKFDFFFKKVLNKFFPKHLLEEFKINYINIINFYKFNKDLKYIINESFISDDWSNFNLAVGKEFFNVKHIYNEHNYLHYPLYANRINEFANNVDFYFSIGWKNKKFPQVLKGSNLSILRNNKNYKKKYKILFLPTVSFSRKPYFANYISKETGYEYYKTSINFLKKLNSDVKDNLSIKLHPRSFNYLGFEYYYKELKDFEIIKKEYPSIEIIKKSELIVVDHYSTLFVELMKLNVPFIIILGDNFIYQSNYKFNDFESLIKNQVIHLNTESASKFINKIYGKHLEWWASKKVKISVENFRKNNLGNEVEFINKILELSNK